MSYMGARICVSRTKIENGPEIDFANILIQKCIVLYSM